MTESLHVPLARPVSAGKAAYRPGTWRTADREWVLSRPRTGTLSPARARWWEISPSCSGTGSMQERQRLLQRHGLDGRRFVTLREAAQALTVALHQEQRR